MSQELITSGQIMNEEYQNDWNPRDPAVSENQRQAYDEMRRRCPVAHSQFLGWSLFQHKDVTAVLANPETYSNVSQFLAIPNGMDPPIHDRYREALDTLFAPDQMARMEPHARKIAADLLVPMLTTGEV